MTKKELKRERKARKHWKRRAKRAEKMLAHTQKPVTLRWSTPTPGYESHTITVTPEVPYTFVPSVFNAPMPQPTIGYGYPKLGDVICDTTQ